MREVRGEQSDGFDLRETPITAFRKRGRQQGGQASKAYRDLFLSAKIKKLRLD